MLLCALVVGLVAVALLVDEGGRPRLPKPPAAFGAPVEVRVGGTSVRAEVADTAARRAYGLMGRDAVPPGTGMLFTYPEPGAGRFWMAGVRVPLVAVFARRGRVVDVVRMEPCGATDLDDCPRYASRAPYDTVLEVAPRTLPRAPEVGSAMTVRTTQPSRGESGASVRVPQRILGQG